MVTSSWKAQEEGLAGFVSHTAIIVAATRLAEAKHKQPILVDPLLEAMLRSSPGVEKAVKEFKEQTDAQEKEDGVDHVAAFTSVRMRYGDEQLLRLLPSGHAQVSSSLTVTFTSISNSSVEMAADGPGGYPWLRVGYSIVETCP